ncbi:glycosyltransferase [Undibacterium fentianense]|uniref:Glycosyltransferase n=1 Tax=Undibacterium fentianense TaxID=2828728 RepID=A0A941DX15_9BURK|nr:glycosyltransferase [Undibacterium fentianense]MBR7798954.1 glycosyltransferase [Undibacterium fentianense]
MKILFVHQNFPAQFKHLAPALARDTNNEIKAICLTPQLGKVWNGVSIHKYATRRVNSRDIHPWLISTESKIIRAEAVMYCARELAKQGFHPDLIFAHPGWGEAMFLKLVWPNAKLLLYSEFYYHSKGFDTGFDPEFPLAGIGSECSIELKNMHNLFQMQNADAALSPTHWQASSFPSWFQTKLRVIHDGIDTDLVRPDEQISFQVNSALTVTKKDEIITFINRNFEPYRGYHIFMRALPALLKARPNAQVLLVGGESVSYGESAPKGQNWKTIFFDEIKPQLSQQEIQRIHFLGTVPYARYLALLQVSRVHVYLTYPFILSWSLLEAMSAGCAIVASNTEPVSEVIQDGVQGKLMNFFDSDGLQKTICDLLENKDERQRLSTNARQLVRERYDLKTVCLPAQLAWVKSHGTAL